MSRIKDRLLEDTKDPILKAAINGYFDLDPRLFPPDVEDVMKRSFLSISGAVNQRGHMVMAGSMALELATTQSNKQQRQRFLKATNSLLKPVARQQDIMDVDFGSRQTVQAQRFLGIAGLVGRQGLQHGMYQNGILEQLQKIWDHFGQMSPGTAGHQHDKGFLVEQSVLGVLNSPVAREVGLLAYQSFERQDTNTTRVGGLKYSWDVGVESDGSYIPQGYYRIQAKTKVHAEDSARYHPDLALIDAAQHLGDNPYMGLRHVAAQDLLVNNEAAIEQHLERVTAELAKKTPVQYSILLAA